MPRDRIDDNDSPINAEPEQLTMLRFELAEVESKIQRLNACKPIGVVNKALAFYHIQRDALRAQIKVWQESDLELPF